MKFQLVGTKEEYVKENNNKINKITRRTIMAKVKKEVIEAAMLKLVDNITATMPNTTYKFLLGGAAGLLSLGGIDKLKNTINMFEDENGLIETQKIKQIYQSAFAASGGKLQIELFNKPDSLISLFVKPLTLTISQ
jgi:hypothetical protein